MLRTTIVALTLTGILVFSGCNSCDSTNHTSGIIVQDLGDVGCYMLNPTTQGFIIDRQGQFDSLFTDTIAMSACTKVPVVDFEKYTVLGIKAFGICKSGFARDVTESEVKKKYVYKVKVTNCGACRDSTGSFNWVTIPRRKDGYIISFEVTK